MKGSLFIALLLMQIFCLGQELPPVVTEHLEELAEAKEEEPQADVHYLEQLEYYQRHRLHLNSASPEELEQLHLLSELQIKSLQQYIRLTGKLIDPMELQAVPLFDLTTIRRLLPYITTTDPPSLQRDFFSRLHGEQSVLVRFSRVLQKQKGYDPSLSNHYLGSPDRLLFWYRYQYRNLLYFGLTGEKDPGEQFFRGRHSSGFDFYSFHFFLQQLRCIKSLALGDYTINLGQGLIQWQSFGFGKSGEVLEIKRSAPVLLPYRSAGESNFFRGLGLSLQRKNWEATGFASYKKISASLQNDSIESFSTLLRSGYYRSLSEIQYRHDLSQLSYGGNISFQNTVVKIGINAVMHHFGYPMQKKEEPYQLFAFSGTKASGLSIDYSYTFRNFHFFGEAAVDQQFHRAVVSGALLSADPGIDLSFLYRNMQKEYNTLSGDAFTENSLPQNEEGMYLGVSIHPSALWQCNAYADFFYFHWLRYRINAPAGGHDYLVQLVYTPSKQSEWTLRFKSKSKPLDNSSDSNVIDYTEQQVRQTIRIGGTNKLSRSFLLRTRIEMLWQYTKDGATEPGFLAFAETSLHPFRQWKLAARVQYFETGSYNSRIYISETDVMFSSSVPAFYQKGFFYFLNVQYQVRKNFSLWLRCSQLIYPGKISIGSGLDEIKGNRKTEVKMQMQLRF